MLGIFKPQKSKTVFIGVAGTRGKTTLVHTLHHIFQSSGQRAGYLSSLGLCIDKEFSDQIDAHNVTKKNIKKIISKVRDNLDFFIFEITSKNLKNKVYDGLVLQSGILTNIEEDSIQHYKTIQDYAQTKLDFINLIESGGFLVLNSQDNNLVRWVDQMSSSVKKPIYSQWVSHNNVYNPKFFLDGMSFYLENFGEVKAPMIGRFNLTNLLKAITLSNKYLSADEIIRALDTLDVPEGRLDFARKYPNFVIIDQAKHADAISEALLYLTKTKPASSRIISILGTNSENNPSVRAGKPAALYSDLVILTSQDPDSENTFSINTRIHSYGEENRGILLERFGSTDEYAMQDKNKLKARIEKIWNKQDVPFIAFDEDNYTGRLDAIKFALEMARPNDIIYISGKGHENTIRYSNVDYEWSDYEAVRLASSEKNGVKIDL